MGSRPSSFHKSLVRARDFLHYQVSAHTGIFQGDKVDLRKIPSLALLLACGLGIGAVHADQRTTLAKSVTFSTDNWYPLPESDIKRAVSDTALSVLTQRTEFAISDTGNNGEIRILVSLIGPAETAKATIEIDAPQTGSLVSTASLSLRNMDYQDIFNAFQHIGAEAANRMVTQVQARLNNAPPLDTGNDAQMQALFDKATRFKRDAKFAAAKDIFLQIAQQESAEGAGHWPELATDEIRYGLPMFHAKYLLTGGGRFSVNPDNMFSNLTKAENLLRQIYAENAGSAERIQEAQAMLDNIQISRNAIRRATQASALSHLSPLKTVFAEYIMTQGVCPDEAFVAQTSEDMQTGFTVDDTNGDESKRSYRLSDPKSGLAVEMRCDARNFNRPISLETL